MNEKTRSTLPAVAVALVAGLIIGGVCGAYATRSVAVDLRNENRLLRLNEPRYSSAVPDAAPNEQIIDKFQAVEIVRQIAAKEVPEAILVLDVREKDSDFWVHVDYGHSRNEKGEVVGFAYDSGQTYVVSDRGKILRIGGHAGWRAP